jgi:two-component system, NtrC family, response regulator AtoC
LSSYDVDTAHDANFEAEPLGDLGKALLIYHREGLDVVPLSEGNPIVVGRSDPAQVRPKSRRLSRQHARFVLEDGIVTVEDMGSTNGTYINGKRISRRASVRGNDEVTLGSVMISVHEHGSLQRRLHGLESHEGWVSALTDEVNRARTFQRSVAVLMIRSLSRRGHLSRWVPRIRELTRNVDRVGLFGPDAVEIMLPESDLDVARRLADEVIKGRADNEPPLVCGVAIYPDDASSALELCSAASDAVAGASLAEPVKFLKNANIWLSADPDDQGPVVRDPAMVTVYETIERVAHSNLPILIEGETGTGKEVIARAIHDRSERRDKPMRCINCGAIPSQLIESVLFGHERGAFTGAERRTKGVFEEAAGGTVLLDEIGELAASAQVALLRVLETKRLTRVGSHTEIGVNVRVLAATHRDIEAMTKDGSFRLDLFYRLNTLTFTIPPLRNRRDEIAPLVRRFVKLANGANGRAILGISPEAMATMTAYPWPGNVRELRNAVDRAVVIAVGDFITVDDLPERVRRFDPLGDSIDDWKESPEPTDMVTRAVPIDPSGLDLKRQVRAYEIELIRGALCSASNNQTDAAQLLQMPRRTLVYKIRAYRIRSSKGEGKPLAEVRGDTGHPLSFKERVERLEVRIVREALNRTAGDRATASRLLGIQKRTLDTKIGRFGIG